jgi:hypothetical protein
MSHLLAPLMSHAERAYVRMQAAELISHCLERGDMSLFDQLLAQLVLAGESSLPILREIRDEIRAQQSQLRQEGLSVRQELKAALAGLGVQLPQLLGGDIPEMLWQMRGPDLPARIRSAARQLSEEDIGSVAEACSEARGRVTQIAARLTAMRALEDSVDDWLSGLAYQAARSGEDTPPLPPAGAIH